MIGKYQILPQFADSDRLTLEWYPYFMRRSKPNYKSASLNTDELGFRVTLQNNYNKLSYNDYLKADSPHGIIVGNSTAFGIGISSDAYTVPSRLNNDLKNGDCLWFNFSNRASNLTQDRIIAELYAPLQADYFVLFSGLNNLIVMLLGEGGSDNCCPFVGEPTFFKIMQNCHSPANHLSAPKQLKDLAPIEILEKRYQTIKYTMEKDLMLISSIWHTQGCRILFCLQPALAWTGKSLSKEEEILVAAWDNDPSLLRNVHKPGILNQWRERFIDDLQSCCQKNHIDFIDLSIDPIISSAKWIFADRVHLCNNGHARVAEIIRDWMQ